MIIRKFFRVKVIKKYVLIMIIRILLNLEIWFLELVKILNLKLELKMQIMFVLLMEENLIF
jgi:hypothetical protein